MPTIRRPGSVIAEPDTAAPPPSEPGAPAEHSLPALHVPPETTPTWELEMLVSGAVLFGLFQIPPVMSAAFQSVTPRLGETSAVVAFESYLFARAMLYALIAGFVLHLAARAYWVALVGLDSVFPGGIRWERARVGPVAREVFRERLPSLPTRIERMDNFASVIFAAVFGIVFMMLVSLGLVAVIAATTWLVTRFVAPALAFRRVFLVLISVFFVGPLLTLLLDRRIGGRVRRDSIGGRLIRGAAVFFYRVQGVAIHGPILQTLYTNVRQKIVVPVMILTMVSAIMAAALSMLLEKRAVGLDGYGVLPRSGAAVLDYRHYADQRTGGDTYSTVPFIQSDVMRDPYVRLFVPYRPRGEDDALARACPAAVALARADQPARQQVATVQRVRESAAAGLLTCLTRLRPVSLDGRSIDPGFRFYLDPQSGLRGLLGYIGTDGLAKGSHILVVQPVPLARDAEREDSLGFHADSIPFRL